MHRYSVVLVFLEEDESLDERRDFLDEEDLGVITGSRLPSGTRSSTNFSSSRNVLLSIESMTMSNSSGEP